MKILYLIRHGQTQWNLERRMQGRLDSPLTETGIKQAHKHGSLLKVIADIGALYVSPSGRTRETAYVVNSYVHAPVAYADALLERDLGEWSGMTMDEISETYPSAHKARQDDPYHFRPPGGENLEDMRERVSEFLSGLRESSKDEIAVVTHQVMSRVIISTLLDLDAPQTARVVHPNEIFYRLEFDNEKVDVTHFLNGGEPRDGLLQHSDSETIARLDTRDTDVRE